MEMFSVISTLILIYYVIYIIPKKLKESENGLKNNRIKINQLIDYIKTLEKEKKFM